jgi:CheY-like chemotaxis protein
MGMHVYDEQSIQHEKVDLMIFETMLKPGENLTHIKEQYGTEQVILFALKSIDQRKLKKVDGTLEEPVSRHALLQKIVNRQHELRRSVTSEYTKQLSGVALIVDDNRLNRVALQSILQKLGIQSKLAESGQKAIEMIKQESFDLILMDIQMPHMDGIEATRRIRSLGNAYQKVPIIAVTANAYFNDYDLLKASQINDVIFKPIKMEALAQSLRKYLVQNETIRIPDELFIFDRGDFLKRFEGSYDIAKEVILTFQSEYLKDIEKMRQAVKEKNPEAIIQTAHYYKGSCAYLSGKRLVWVLTRMMDHAKQDMLDEMNDLFELIVKESESLINELQTMKALG